MKPAWIFWGFLFFLGLGIHGRLIQGHWHTLPASPDRHPRDPLTLFEGELAKIKPYLPAHGPIGLVSDINDPTLIYKVQYVLSPTVITWGPGPNRVMGMFSHPASLELWPLKGTYRILRDFQDGLVLLERRAP